MAISSKTRKMLWGKSGAKCAICKTDLVVQSESSEAYFIIGDECHISAQNPDGPRYDGEMSKEDRDNGGNLILLCKNHHKIVDDDISTYTIDFLLSLKRDHEESISKSEQTFHNKAIVAAPIVSADDVGSYSGTVEELELTVQEIAACAKLNPDQPPYTIKFDLDNDSPTTLQLLPPDSNPDIEQRTKSLREAKLKIRLMELQGAIAKGVNAILFCRHLSMHMFSPRDTAEALRSYMGFLKLGAPTYLDLTKTRIDVFREERPSLCVPINLEQSEVVHLFATYGVRDIREFQVLTPHPAYGLPTTLISKKLVPRMVWYADRYSLLPSKNEDSSIFDLSKWKVGLG
jgi:hypothetical protein